MKLAFAAIHCTRNSMKIKKVDRFTKKTLLETIEFGQFEHDQILSRNIDPDVIHSHIT